MVEWLLPIRQACRQMVSYVTSFIALPNLFSLKKNYEQFWFSSENTLQFAVLLQAWIVFFFNPKMWLYQYIHIKRKEVKKTSNREDLIEETFGWLNLNLDILTNVLGDNFGFLHLSLGKHSDIRFTSIAWTLCMYDQGWCIEDSTYMRNDKDGITYEKAIGYGLTLVLFLNVRYCSCSQIHIMLLATMAYVICLVGIISMYIWYVPQPTCLLNIFFITWTLVLLQLMTSVSLHPKVSSNIINTSIVRFHLTDDLVYDC